MPIPVAMEDMCTHCGHAERDHRHQRCEARVAADGGLTIGRCSCGGFSADPAAAAAQPLEPLDLHLRRPNESLPASYY
jgi:hypothetical protein